MITAGDTDDLRDLPWNWRRAAESQHGREGPATASRALPHVHGVRLRLLLRPCGMSGQGGAGEFRAQLLRSCNTSELTYSVGPPSTSPSETWQATRDGPNAAHRRLLPLPLLEGRSEPLLPDLRPLLWRQSNAVVAILVVLR